MKQAWSAVMLLATFAAAGTAGEQLYAPNRLIVKFKTEVTIELRDGAVRTGIAVLDGLNQRWGIAQAGKLFVGPPNPRASAMGLDRVYVLDAARPIDVKQAAAEYAAQGLVEYVEPDYVGHGDATTPNDPSYGLQWGLKNTGQNPGGGHAGVSGCDIDAEPAWDVERGNRDIVVGHLDSGIDLDHPDLASYFQAGVVWRNVDEVPRNSIDDDGNGYVDDTIGWNFCDTAPARPLGTNNVQDDHFMGHGTHTAGIIAAHTSNSRGVAGTCWYSQLMVLKVINSANSFYYSHLCRAIRYGVDNGARVLNMSLSGTIVSSAMQDAVNYAWSSGVLPVASMGNDNNNVEHFPAAYDNALAVGATDNDDDRVVPGHNGADWGSCYGSWIDVVAPGNYVYSTLLNDTYAYMGGTSMSAPYVAGLAALILSRNPDLTGSEVRSIIRSTAEDKGTPGFDDYYGYGRVNAYQALQQVQFLPGWTAESLLASGPGECYEPDVAVSGQNVHIVYSDRGGTGRTMGLYYLRSTNGGRSFEAARLLSAYTTNWGNWYPHIAMSGTALRVVFQDTRSTNCGIYFKQSADNGQNWGGDALVSNSAVVSYAPDICCSGDTIHVIWNVGYRRSTNAAGSWDAINAAVSGQTIACANGKVFVAGHTLVSGSYRVTSQRYNGTGWDAAVEFTNNGTCWPNPDVAAEGNNVYIVWDHETDTDGTADEIRLRRSTDAGANWQAAKQLAVLGENYCFRNPRVTSNTGRVYLVWWGDRDMYWSCDVYYRRSANSGADWGNTYRLCYNTYNDLDQMPAVGVFADTVHVVWERMASGTKTVRYIRKGISLPSVHDVSAYRIMAPSGIINSGTNVTPQAKVRNLGGASESFSVRFRVGSAYTQDATVSSLAAGDSVTVSFPVWFAVRGSYTLSCSTMLSTDANRSNDKCTGSVQVVSVGGGWDGKADVPPGASAKPVDKGGAMCGYGASALFAFKGSNTYEFFQYDIAGNQWQEKQAIPGGTEGKPPKKGASLCSDGERYVYAVKGNNRLAFWRYDVSAGQWQQMPDVPAGTYRVKDGSGLTYAERNDTGYVYLLKGNKNEFYRYNCAKDSWQQLTAAPAGTSGYAKYKDGSSLAVGSDGHTIYCLKAKYNEVFSYDAATDQWQPQLVSVPLIGALGRKRKVGAGGGLAYLDGLYCLKGGNSQELWRLDGGTWAELDTLPRGASGRRVKSGGAIAQAQGGIWVLKGNKTRELWQFDAGSVCSHRSGDREGVMARPAATGFSVRLAGNPVHDKAVIRLNLPEAVPVSARVFDITGRTVLSVPPIHSGSSCELSLDCGHLSAGIYLLKVEAGGQHKEFKLVVP